MATKNKEGKCMKVIIKEPGKNPVITEVEDMVTINKIVGNVDGNGNGVDTTGSDSRGSIGKGIDQYNKDDALNNLRLDGNLWNQYDTGVLCGNIVFAGYDPNSKANFGAVSLTDEQIKYCLEYIEERRTRF